ncbi:MAG TPA: non-homologous end-joining DNA ligase [Agriterribacter sp.]|nr:non-homologous end-joining DNA ligase [Agriterribacter sp.]
MRLSGRKIDPYIKPMLATAVHTVFDSEDWVFELKLDGYRAITEIKSKKILLYSRNGLDFSTHYPSIYESLKNIRENMIIDGEIVLVDRNGKPDFQRLQNRKNEAGYTLLYYVFDILSYKNKSVKDRPLIQRKALLQKVLPVTHHIRYSEHVEKEGKKLFRLVKARKMEGIMAKKKDSLYKPGYRTKDWLKIKFHRSQEAIIIGFTKPKGSRKHFGALLLAQYQGKKLKYIGHAGTGFSEKKLDEVMLQMKPLITPKKPLQDDINANDVVTWIKPQLVCEVGYSEITKDGILRHPVFKGLRNDKNSTAVQQKTEQEIETKTVVPAIRKTTIRTLRKTKKKKA